YLYAFYRRDIRRGRQVINDRVEQGLHPFVFEGRTTQHRNKGPCDRALADAPLQQVFGRLIAAEISFERPIVLLDRRLDQSRSERSGLLDHVGGNFDDVEFFAPGLVAPFYRPKADGSENSVKVTL